MFWHPKGARVRHVIETFWKDLHMAAGYDLVYSPHIAKVGALKLRRQHCWAAAACVQLC